MIGGKEIGKVQSLSLDPIEEIKPIKSIPRLEGSFTCRGGITKAGEEFLNNMINPTFDVEVERSTYAPPRKLRSKKKRIVRKWRKKYTKVYSREIYRNCTIEGVNY